MIEFVTQQEFESRKKILLQHLKTAPESLRDNVYKKFVETVRIKGNVKGKKSKFRHGIDCTNFNALYYDYSKHIVDTIKFIEKNKTADESILKEFNQLLEESKKYDIVERALFVIFLRYYVRNFNKTDSNTLCNPETYEVDIPFAGISKTIVYFIKEDLEKLVPLIDEALENLFNPKEDQVQLIKLSRNYDLDKKIARRIKFCFFESKG